jgi:hypothetical protein
VTLCLFFSYGVEAGLWGCPMADGCLRASSTADGFTVKVQEDSKMFFPTSRGILEPEEAHLHGEQINRSLEDLRQSYFHAKSNIPTRVLSIPGYQSFSILNSKGYQFPI